MFYRISFSLYTGVRLDRSLLGLDNVSLDSIAIRKFSYDGGRLNRIIMLSNSSGIFISISLRLPVISKKLLRWLCMSSPWVNLLGTKYWYKPHTNCCEYIACNLSQTDFDVVQPHICLSSDSDSNRIISALAFKFSLLNCAVVTTFASVGKVLVPLTKSHRSFFMRTARA